MKRIHINIGRYIKLYFVVSMIIPSFITIALFIVMVVLGIEPKLFQDGFWNAIYTVWIKYYYNGNIDGISSWRIHLATLICVIIGHILLEKMDNSNGGE